MSIDLEGALADLARSVHDDGATERMNGQVRHMVGRIRRRRAARYSATGVVGAGAVAAVAVGGLQLADRSPAPVVPATPLISHAQCGDPAPVVQDEAGGRLGSIRQTGGLYLQLGPIAPTPEGSALTFVAELVNGSDDPASLTDAAGPARFLVVQDDVVLATGEFGAARSVALWGGEILSWRESVELVSCGGERAGEPLPAGIYALVVAYPLVLDDGKEIEVAAISRFTITEAPQASVDPVPAEAAATSLEELLAAAPADNPDLVFPKCGTLASDALDDGMPPLELDLDEADLRLASGSRYEGTVRLHTTLGRHVIANASQTAKLVVLRDGIVVGYQWLDGEDVDIVDLADGQMLRFPVLGTMNLCGTGEGGSGPAVPLPAGEYRIMAALDVMLKEIAEPGGEAESITATTTAVSEAGRLTLIAAPAG